MVTQKKFVPIFFLTSIALIFIWSAIKPHDYFTWLLEVAPAIIGGTVLLLTFKKFKFTTLVYILIWVHAIILIVGGKYTYELNPLFEWIKHTFELARNNYDRLGHFAQGFIPALIIREVLLRKSPLQRGKWLFVIVCSMCLSISAIYEFVEWWTAVGMGNSADAFLGSQGDIWDAQWDMFLAFIGSIIAQITLGRFHDKQLNKLDELI